jgi:alpha-amylase
MLKALCDEYAFSLRRMATWDTVLQKQPQSVVSFVENHDVRDDGRPIRNDKLLAYSYMLTHEGYPCVYWQDYFNLGLGMPETPNGIAALVQAHETLAAGGTQTLHLDDDLYIMQRTGFQDKPGLLYVLNNRGDAWRGDWVTTRWPGATLRPVAWWGRTDRSRPEDQVTGPDGRGQFYAAPRGYTVYAPK